MPTEAEWEYACRAETTGAFSYDGELALDKVNYRGTWEYENDKWGEGALQKTAEVKSYPPNSWGLYQMHGNVWEWCQDWYGEYPTGTVIDPQGPDTGVHRVLRGGSWSQRRQALPFCLTATTSPRPSMRTYSFGFRLARGHEPSQASAGQQPNGTHAAVARGAHAGDGLQAAEGKQKTKIASTKKAQGVLDNIKDLFKK